MRDGFLVVSTALTRGPRRASEKGRKVWNLVNMMGLVGHCRIRRLNQYRFEKKKKRKKRKERNLDVEEVK